MVIISQNIHISKYHVVHLKYVQFLSESQVLIGTEVEELKPSLNSGKLKWRRLCSGPGGLSFNEVGPRATGGRSGA